MTTTTYRMVNGELVAVRKTETPSARVHVVGDIAAYESPVTGEMIEGRRAHKEHMVRHNLEEVGNEGHPSTHKRKSPVDQPGYEKQLRNDIEKAIKDIEYDRAPTLERLRQMTPDVRRDLGLDE